MPTGIRSIGIRTVSEMWKYIKRYLPYGILAALFMVGEVLMDQGQIVEQGTHEELLTRQGKYYALYMTQFAGFAT